MILKYTRIDGHEVLVQKNCLGRYNATTRDYEPCAPVGSGDTPQQAIDDLMFWIEDSTAHLEGHDWLRPTQAMKEDNIRRWGFQAGGDLC